MRIDNDSPLWTYPGGAKSDLLYENRFEVSLSGYEEYLVDEYIECQLRLNNNGTEWWLGRLESIESNVIYLKEHGIVFDKVFEVMHYLPCYKDMSKKSQENYRRICGGAPDE